MKWYFALVLFISVGVQAQTFSRTNFDRILDGNGRAEISIERVRPASMNWGRVVNELKRSHSGCGPAMINFSSTDALSSLDRFYDERGLVQFLASLYKKNLIVKTIVAADGDEGESEYCSRSTFKFFAKDGEVLTISFDYNT